MPGPVVPRAADTPLIRPNLDSTAGAWRHRARSFGPARGTYCRLDIPCGIRLLHRSPRARRGGNRRLGPFIARGGLATGAAILRADRKGRCQRPGIAERLGQYGVIVGADGENNALGALYRVPETLREDQKDAQGQ